VHLIEDAVLSACLFSAKVFSMWAVFFFTKHMVLGTNAKPLKCYLYCVLTSMGIALFVAYSPETNRIKDRAVQELLIKTAIGCTVCTCAGASQGIQQRGKIGQADEIRMERERESKSIEKGYLMGWIHRHQGKTMDASIVRDAALRRAITEGALGEHNA
jgi:hypothetical protein